MEYPAEVLFYRPNARCKLEHQVEQISAQRAIYLQRGGSVV
jgi:hypothetical protein